jgi:hypothetical protein
MAPNKTKPSERTTESTTTSTAEPTDLQAYVSRRIAPRRARVAPIEPLWVQADFEASWPLVLADTSVA